MALSFVAGLAALACSPTNDRAADNVIQPSAGASNTARADANSAALWTGYPMAQPDGSPLTAEYCRKADELADNPFDNIKTCLMIACDMGDKPSCEGAASFNGNMWPDGEPPKNSNQQESAAGS